MKSRCLVKPRLQVCTPQTHRQSELTGGHGADGAVGGGVGLLRDEGVEVESDLADVGLGLAHREAAGGRVAARAGEVAVVDAGARAAAAWAHT